MEEAIALTATTADLLAVACLGVNCCNLVGSHTTKLIETRDREEDVLQELDNPATAHTSATAIMPPRRRTIVRTIIVRGMMVILLLLDFRVLDRLRALARFTTALKGAMAVVVWASLVAMVTVLVLEEALGLKEGSEVLKAMAVIMAMVDINGMRIPQSTRRGFDR